MVEWNNTFILLLKIMQTIPFRGFTYIRQEAPKGELVGIRRLVQSIDFDLRLFPQHRYTYCYNK